MEENSKQKSKINNNIELWFGEGENIIKQKCLTKSKIKAMQGRIFWSRNNSQSSLEKIKMKKVKQQFDKLKQLRQNDQKMRYQLKQLVKKLSLPKIKQSTSLHSTVQISKIIQVSKKNRQSSQQFEKTSFKRKKQDRDIDKVLQRYNKRCEKQIQQFNFQQNQTISNSIMREKTEKKQKVSKQYKNPLSQQLQNGYLPTKILGYLTKYVR